MGVTSADAWGRGIERMFGMSDAAWERHANPWSGWTRMLILPLLTLAIWSRVWIGWWALAPIAALVLWTWLNPRAFPAPNRTDNWMSKAVFGERVWLNRRAVPIPERHLNTMNALTAGQIVGLPFYVYGLWALDLPLTLLGAVISVGLKFWFLDRCVWLFEEMQAVHPPYQNWLKPAPRPT